MGGQRVKQAVSAISRLFNPPAIVAAFPNFPVTLLFDPPPTKEFCPLATFNFPPDTTAAVDDATLFCPPETVDPCCPAKFCCPPAIVDSVPTAWFLPPPPTVDRVALAKLFDPPPTVDFNPIATFFVPPPTDDSSPNRRRHSRTRRISSHRSRSRCFGHRPRWWTDPRTRCWNRRATTKKNSK